MGDAKMTARDRVVAASLASPASDLDVRLEAIAREVAAAPVKLSLDDATRVAETHANAATAEARERIKELEAEKFEILTRLDELVRERDEALARVTEMKALLHDVMRDTGIEYRDSSWPALVPSDWFLRRATTLEKGADSE